MNYDFSVCSVDAVLYRAALPNWHMTRTRDPRSYYLCAVLSGEADYTFYNTPPSHLHVVPNDILFFTRDCERSAVTSPNNPWKFITIRFSLNFFHPDDATAFSLPLVSPKQPSTVINLFHEIVQVWEGKGLAYPLKCRTLVAEILYELIRSSVIAQLPTKHFESMESVRRYIQDHPKQSFSTEILAQLAHCSPSHFRTLFKQTFGMTAAQYSTLLRIEKARDLLVSGEMNVSEAAEAVGYRDIFYFSRQFKAITGVPPSSLIPRFPASNTNDDLSNEVTL